ncbi:MAG: DUF1772 domain-containing protein [Nostoc sp.]|uniref:DUF1772 domain-containing protein n=1 Tax=Nostoc sp. TaxID=1180 RepID=UPI002FF7257A
MTILIVSGVLALVVAGLMVGNEITVGFFVHPQLWKLDDATHVKAAQPLARIFGAFMPFWYAATLITSSFFTYQLHTLSNPIFFRFAIAATVIWLLSIICTIVALAPINDEVAKWNLENLPKNWKERRRLWDNRHAIRVIALLIAFIFLTIACVGR